MSQLLASTPPDMDVVVVDGGRGGPEALKLARAPTPVPGPGEILIKVRAAGVNRPDVLQRRGFYPPPPGAPETLGLEAAGEVVGLGEGAERWVLGDRVTALLPGGGYAGYARLDARHALPIPEGLDFADAAALPETIFTVWANVFEGGALKAGETLLVHGATSGIGVAAIRMAKAFGARVVATSRGDEKAKTAERLGADLALDAAGGTFAPAVKAFGGADVILDMVGAPYFAENLACLNDGGRVVYIATQGGAEAKVDLLDLMRRRLTLTGSTLRPRSPDEKARLARAIEAAVWPHVAAGRIRTIIEDVLPLGAAGEAHRRLEAGDHVGKFILTP